MCGRDSRMRGTTPDVVVSRPNVRTVKRIFTTVVRPTPRTVSCGGAFRGRRPTVIEALPHEGGDV